MVYLLKDKRFYFLWIASIFGAIAVLPYVAVVHSVVTISSNLVVSSLIQAAFLYAFIVFFGLTMSKKLNFKLITGNNFLVPSIISGLCIGFSIKLLDKFLFSFNANLLLEQVAYIVPWKGFLASFYGAINEEVLLRLFSVSLFVLLFQKFLKISKSYCIIISIVFCALLFGLGHLPTLYKTCGDPNIWDFLRIITLNGFAGVIFGLLYWKYGLISSMLAHFIADLLIHVL